jgi:hypothetical protein
MRVIRMTNRQKQKRNWMIFGGALFVLIGWFAFRPFMFTVLLTGVATWAVSRMIVRVPEGTAVIVDRQVYLNYADHMLDADGNVVDCHGLRYDEWYFVGLSGLLGNKRVTWIERNLRSIKMASIPLKGIRMEVSVQNTSREGEEVELMLALWARVTRIDVDDWDWAARIRGFFKVHGGAIIGRHKIASLRAQREKIATRLQEATATAPELEGIEIQQVRVLANNENIA